MPQTVMIMKSADELPSHLKHLPADFCPKPKQPVMVVGEEKYHERVMLRVKHGAKIVTLDSAHFRTPQNHQLREKLLKKPPTKKIQRILKTL